MEVRAAYARDDFEWYHMEKISLKELEEGNTRIMREHAELSFEKTFKSDKQ